MATHTSALDTNDALVSFKLGLLERALPASSVVVFGDMWRVDGGYTRRCAELGCARVLLIDMIETVTWLETRSTYPAVDFYKGDFSNAAFMASITETFQAGVAFDILLHEAPLLHTLHLMLERVEGRFCLAQPMLVEQAVPNALIYLPGNPDPGLYPLQERSDDFKLFDPMAVNASSWIWGMTRSFVRSALAGEGFEILIECDGPPLPSPHWSWWGCVAQRAAVNDQHWSRSRPWAGFYTDDP